MPLRLAPGCPVRERPELGARDVERAHDPRQVAGALPGSLARRWPASARLHDRHRAPSHRLQSRRASQVQTVVGHGQPQRLHQRGQLVSW
eukprot:4213588-Pyramimonas_sp.AAC.1